MNLPPPVGLTGPLLNFSLAQFHSGLNTSLNCLRRFCIRAECACWCSGRFKLKSVFFTSASQRRIVNAEADATEPISKSREMQAGYLSSARNECATKAASGCPTIQQVGIEAKFGRCSRAPAAAAMLASRLASRAFPV